MEVSWPPFNVDITFISHFIPRQGCLYIETSGTAVTGEILYDVSIPILSVIESWQCKPGYIPCGMAWSRRHGATTSSICIYCILHVTIQARATWRSTGSGLVTLSPMNMAWVSTGLRCASDLRGELLLFTYQWDRCGISISTCTYEKDILYGVHSTFLNPPCSTYMPTWSVECYIEIISSNIELIQLSSYWIQSSALTVHQITSHP